MTTILTCALVECCHGFICRSCLNLHEISSLVLTPGTVYVCAVHVLPGRGAAQHVVHLLELGECLVADPPGDVVHVGAGGAREPEAALALLTL